MTDNSMAPSRQSLNTTVYDAIKNQILDNKLRPGAKLIHQQLAKELNVSRTPVREALERLFQEGFVTHVPHRGFTVSEITRQEAFELYQMREALETFAVRFVASDRAAELDLPRLRALNDRYLDLVKAERMRQRMLVDRDFHLLIAQATGNEFLVRTLNAVFERIILKMRTDGFWTTRGLAAHSEHEKLIKALSLRDGSGAAAILGKHIHDARNKVLDQVEEVESNRF